MAKLKQEEAKKAAGVVGSGSSSGGGSNSGAYDTIFQTLMEEVTSVELSQSILESYVTYLQQCVVTVVDEMKVEQERERSNLLATVEQLKVLMDSAARMNHDLKEEVRVMWDRMMVCFMGLSLFGLILLWCARILRRGSGSSGGGGSSTRMTTPTKMNEYH